ncbi:MAG TPA: hypothetical protein VGE63_03340 [Candidatus Paceibacterota bacterium]
MELIAVKSLFAQAPLGITKKDGKDRYLYVDSPKFDKVVEVDGFYSQNEITPGTSPQDVVKGNSALAIGSVQGLMWTFPDGKKFPVNQIPFKNEISAGSRPMTRTVLLLDKAKVIYVKETGQPLYIADCNRCTANCDDEAKAVWKNRPNRLRMVDNEAYWREFIGLVTSQTQGGPSGVVTDEGQGKVVVIQNNTTPPPTNNPTTQQTGLITQASGMGLVDYFAALELARIEDVKRLMHENIVIDMNGKNAGLAAQYRAQVRVFDGVGQAPQQGSMITTSVYAQQQGQGRMYSAEEVQNILAQQNQQAQRDDYWRQLEFQENKKARNWAIGTSIVGTLGQLFIGGMGLYQTNQFYKAMAGGVGYSGSSSGYGQTPAINIYNNNSNKNSNNNPFNWTPAPPSQPNTGGKPNNPTRPPWVNQHENWMPNVGGPLWQGDPSYRRPWTKSSDGLWVTPANNGRIGYNDLGEPVKVNYTDPAAYTWQNPYNSTGVTPIGSNTQVKWGQPDSNGSFFIPPVTTTGNGNYIPPKSNWGN